MLKNVVTALLAWAVAQTATAQELEYKMELGGALGGTFYIGDANAALFNNMGLAGGAKAAYIFNPRMSQHRRCRHRLSIGNKGHSGDGTVQPHGCRPWRTIRLQLLCLRNGERLQRNAQADALHHGRSRIHLCAIASRGRVHA